MDGKDSNIGTEVLLLLRRERYLWHQLKLLKDRQRDIGSTDSPAEILNIVAGRGKLLTEIRRVESQLGPIRSNWEKLAVELSEEERKASKELDKEILEIRSYAERSKSVMGRLGEWKFGSDFRKAAGVTDLDLQETAGSLS